MNCPICQDTRWKTIEAAGVESVVRCDCWRDELAARLMIYPSTDMAGDYASRAENAEGYFLDLATMVWFSGHYLSGGERLDLADPRLSPIASDVTGVAPAHVITAQYDPLRDEGEALAAKLSAAGVPTTLARYDGQIHGFVSNYTVMEQGRVAIDQAAAALRTAFGTAG